MTTQASFDQRQGSTFADEGRFLGAKLFGAAAIDAGVLASYRAAVTSVVLGGNAAAEGEPRTPKEKRDEGVWRRVVEIALAERVDVQGLELVLRRKWPRNPLSQRAHILAFLLETDASTPNYQRFINGRPSRLSAYLELLWHAASTFYYFLSGLLLLKRLERRARRHV